MSGRSNHCGRSETPNHDEDHVRAASSIVDGPNGSARPEAENQDQDLPSSGPPPNPNPFPPTPESPDEQGISNPCQSDGASSPHIRFDLPVWSTRDRNGFDVREPDPTLPYDLLRLGNTRRPRNGRDGMLRPAVPDVGSSLHTDGNSGESTTFTTQSASPSPPPSSNPSSESTHDPIRVGTEPDVAAAARLGLTRLQRFHYPRDRSRSRYQRCRDWCRTNCKQVWYDVKFTFKKPKSG